MSRTSRHQVHVPVTGLQEKWAASFKTLQIKMGTHTCRKRGNPQGPSYDIYATTLQMTAANLMRSGLFLVRIDKQEGDEYSVNEVAVLTGP